MPQSRKAPAPDCATTCSEAQRPSAACGVAVVAIGRASLSVSTKTSIASPTLASGRRLVPRQGNLAAPSAVQHDPVAFGAQDGEGDDVADDRHGGAQCRRRPSAAPAKRITW